MKLTTFLFCLLILAAGLTVSGQSLYFPPATGTWDTLSPSDLNWCREKLDSLHNYLEVKNSKAFIILKDGKIMVEWYFDGFKQDSLWYWASAGKTVTSMLTGIAQQEGFLDIQDPTSQYLGTGWTDCDSTEEAAITIRHQLTMSSGMDDGHGNSDCTLDTCLQCIAAPGTRWSYHNAPYTLLDGVLEAATGRTLNTYYFQKIGQPIGAPGLFIKLGYNNVFFSKPRNMARFGLLALAKGVWDGTPILSDTAYYRQMVNTSQTINKSYGYLWWLNGKGQHMLPTLQVSFPSDLILNGPDDMFSALGKNDQKIYVIPSQNMVVIRMGDAAGNLALALTSFDNELWGLLSDMECQTNAIDKNEVAISLDIFPNPTYSKISIQSTQALHSVAVLDEMGRVVLSTHEREVDLSNMPSSIYFLKVTFRDGSQVVRKVKKCSL
jgi:CubicO group peptidase (beta-lactamase class C family)